MNSRNKELLKYTELNWKIFPCKERQKVPQINNWKGAATIDKEQLIKWEKDFVQPNWGLYLAASGLVAIDVDTRNGGMNAWKELIHKHGDPQTLIAQTGSDGFHYIFKATEGVQYKGKICDGIDIKHNGYILISPSIHPNGNPYKWISPQLDSVASMPEWLVEKTVIKNKTTAPSKMLSEISSQAQAIQLLVSEAVKFEYTYDEWVQVGMAIHSILPTSEGLNQFLKFTDNLSFKEGDFDAAKTKWTSFSNNKEVTISFGTFLHILRAKGIDCFKLLNSKNISAFSKFSIPEPFDYCKGAMPIDGNIVFFEKEALVSSFNEGGYVFLNKRNGNLIVKTSIGAFGEIEPIIMSKEQFLLKTLPIKFRTLVNKKERTFDAGQIWLGDCRRSSKNDICFKPEHTPNDLNLFSPPKFHGIDGDCSIVIELLQESLCSGKKDLADWFLNYLAHIFQHAGIGVSTVPVLLSTQGTGKGILIDRILRTILGSKRYYRVPDTKFLLDRFNQDLAFRFLTFIDEASALSSKEATTRLKYLVGSENMVIEYKFGDRIEINNYSRYIIATNDSASIPLELGNRRFVIIEGTDKYVKNHAFFKEIISELNNNSLANKFYHYLMNRELSSFKPNEKPSFDSNDFEFKLKNAGLVAQFWHDTLFKNPRKIIRRNELVGKAAFDEFLEFAGSTFFKGSPHSFWEESKKYLPAIGSVKTRDFRNGEYRSRLYPVGLKELRDSFIKCFQVSTPLEEPFGDYEWALEDFFKERINENDF